MHHGYVADMEAAECIVKEFRHKGCEEFSISINAFALSEGRDFPSIMMSLQHVEPTQDKAMGIVSPDNVRVFVLKAENLIIMYA